jgi:hypothetical protein
MKIDRLKRSPTAQVLRRFLQSGDNRGWVTIGLGALIVIALLLFLSTVWDVTAEWAIWAQLRFFGKESPGLVLRREFNTYGEGYQAYLEYAYGSSLTESSQGAYTNREPVSIYLHDHSEPGTTLSVRYLPYWPSITRIEGNYFHRNSSSTLFLKSDPAKRLVTSAIPGTIVMLVVTLVEWSGEVLIDNLHVGPLPLYGGVLGLLLGIPAGIITTICVWRRMRS